MSLQIGGMNRLVIARLVDFGAYLEADSGDILLPRKSVPAGAGVGDSVEVFVYRDSEDRLIAGTRRPLALVGQFASLQVKEVTRLGAFLDWGIERDLLVPFSCQLRPMVAGRRYVVRVSLDEVSQRIIGVGKLKPYLESEAGALAAGDPVSLLIYDETELGFKAVVDGRCDGLLYHDEARRGGVQVGGAANGYVARIRADGKLDLTLRPQGYRATMVAAAPRLLEALVAAGGFLPFTGKSDPELVEARLGMSKRTFKMAVGRLLREGRIVIGEDGIRLAPP